MGMEAWDFWFYCWFWVCIICFCATFSFPVSYLSCVARLCHLWHLVFTCIVIVNQKGKKKGKRSGSFYHAWKPLSRGISHTRRYRDVNGVGSHRAPLLPSPLLVFFSRPSYILCLGLGWGWGILARGASSPSPPLFLSLPLVWVYSIFSFPVLALLEVDPHRDLTWWVFFAIPNIYISCFTKVTF